MKTILLIVIGLAIGYFAGFEDARTHSKNVVARIVERVGGDHRANMVTDVDSKMRDAEK